MQTMLMKMGIDWEILQEMGLEEEIRLFLGDGARNQLFQIIDIDSKELL